MKLLFDLHTHTIASGHAYSTIQENIQAAYDLGLKAYGFSDHSAGSVGGPNYLYFINLKVVPRNYKGMKVCAGVEANIIDFDGKIDVEGRTLERVDYVIASMHPLNLQPGTKEENTRAYLGAMANPHVKIIGHPDDGRYPIDYKALVEGAKKYGVALEVNNSSVHPLNSRVGARENILSMLGYCKEYGVPVLCSTDSHISFDIGHFDYVEEILKEADFPEELVLNTKMENLNKILNHNLYEEEEDGDTRL